MEGTNLQVVTLNDTMWGQESVCWPGVDVLAKRIRLVFPMVNTFYLFIHFCEGGMDIHFYIIKKWPKFFFSLHLFNFDGLFLSIKRSKLTSINQIHIYHKKCFPECLPSPHKHIWYQIFRFQFRKLYVGFRQLAIIF